MISAPGPGQPFCRRTRGGPGLGIGQGDTVHSLVDVGVTFSLCDLSQPEQLRAFVCVSGHKVCHKGSFISGPSPGDRSHNRYRRPTARKPRLFLCGSRTGTTSLCVDGVQGRACWGAAGSVTSLSPRSASDRWCPEEPSHGDVKCRRCAVLDRANHHLAQIRLGGEHSADVHRSHNHLAHCSKPHEAVPLAFKGSLSHRILPITHSPAKLTP